jgi:hypothetical protein
VFHEVNHIRSRRTPTFGTAPISVSAELNPETEGLRSVVARTPASAREGRGTRGHFYIEGIAKIFLRYTSFSVPGESMSSLKEFQCEICGIVSANPIHWFVIECGDQKLAVIKWDLSAANSPTARHFCGEAHAQVYISRWFESFCTPPKAVFKTS